MLKKTDKIDEKKLNICKPNNFHITNKHSIAIEYNSKKIYDKRISKKKMHEKKLKCSYLQDKKAQL